MEPHLKVFFRRHLRVSLQHREHEVGINLGYLLFQRHYLLLVLLIFILMVFVQRTVHVPVVVVHSKFIILIFLVLLSRWRVVSGVLVFIDLDHTGHRLHPPLINQRAPFRHLLLKPLPFKSPLQDILTLVIEAFDIQISVLVFELVNSFLLLFHFLLSYVSIFGTDFMHFLNPLLLDLFGCQQIIWRINQIILL